MSKSIKDFVLDLVAAGHGDNEEIAASVRAAFPGANTSAASVSSIKSQARRAGVLERPHQQVSDVAIVSLVDEDLPDDADEAETDERIGERIEKRFSALDRMARGVINGMVPAMIVSGPAGLGKSRSIRTALHEVASEGKEFTRDIISGSITAVGLYIALWNARAGGVVILDDCDDVFRDETTLNLLKAALDSNEERIISWRKQSYWLKQEEIEPTFDFRGSVIFLTNVDFEREANCGKPSAVHYKALMDRSLYLTLGIKSKRDVTVRIKQVVYQQKMLHAMGLDDAEVEEIMGFVFENKDRFYHLSLRLIYQIGVCYLADPENWKTDVEMTKMKG